MTVCKNTILSNLKNGTDKPPIRVSLGKRGKPTYHHRFLLPPGRAFVVTDMGNPLPWGARVWIEVHRTGEATIETKGHRFPRVSVPVGKRGV